MVKFSGILIARHHFLLPPNLIKAKEASLFGLIAFHDYMIKQTFILLIFY